MVITVGKFYVIEGLDGSGKSTQGELLKAHFEELGKKVRVLSFPCYGEVSCSLVEFYLGGGLGDKAGDTNGYAASMFFASDRFISYKTDWEKDYLDPDTVIISTRYTTSNAYHQLSKLPVEEWDEFLTWLWDLEFGRLGLPEPDEVIYLDMPQAQSSSRVDMRSGETGQTKDIHEKDTDYLVKCYDAAMFSAKKLGWRIISCMDGERQRTKEEVSQLLLDIIEC